jgi:cytochrome c
LNGQDLICANLSPPLQLRTRSLESLWELPKSKQEPPAARPKFQVQNGEVSAVPKQITLLLACAAMLAASIALSHAAERATKDEATAMVKKAVAFIKQEGPEKAYAEISNKKGQFVDRDLYIVVYRLDGHILAHGANEKLIGTDQIAAKDPDGKEFVRERVEVAKKQDSFWQSYKFPDPLTKSVTPKEMYCERLNDTAVCGGVYKP